jgi:ABC-type transporter Mla subunit MlaD
LITTDGDFLSTGVLIGILALFGLVAAAIVIVSVRNGPKRGDGEDMFGSQ